MHAEDAAEQSGLEDDVVTRRGLTGCVRDRLPGGRRPVVLREHERREVHLARAARPGGRGCWCPGCNTVVQGWTSATLGGRSSGLEQPFLLARRAEEDPRLAHEPGLAGESPIAASAAASTWARMSRQRSSPAAYRSATYAG